MTETVVRPYRREDYHQVVELKVGPLKQSRKEAEEVIRWVPTIDYAEILSKLVRKVHGKEVLEGSIWSHLLGMFMQSASTS